MHDWGKSGMGKNRNSWQKFRGSAALILQAADPLTRRGQRTGQPSQINSRNRIRVKGVRKTGSLWPFPGPPECRCPGLAFQ